MDISGKQIENICHASRRCFFERLCIFVDLDATITRAEILPEIAVKINKEQQMRELTEKTMQERSV